MLLSIINLSLFISEEVVHTKFAVLFSKAITLNEVSVTGNVVLPAFAPFNVNLEKNSYHLNYIHWDKQ